MAYNVRSRYQDSWDILKKSKSISLAAPAAAHPRLKEAIKKRKKKDVGFKFLLSESNQIAELEFKSDGSLLKIILHIKYRSDWI